MTTPAPPTIAALNSVTAVEWFKREVARAGTFATLYPEATDDLVASSLVDGLYRAKIDGWMTGIEADPDTTTVTPVISLTACALIIVYAGAQFVRNEIKNMDTVFRAGSAGNTFEREKSPNVLVEILKELQAEKQQLINQASSPIARPVFMHDGYAIRLGTLYNPERMIPLRTITPRQLT